MNNVKISAGLTGKTQVQKCSFMEFLYLIKFYKITFTGFLAILLQWSVKWKTGWDGIGTWELAC